MIIAAVIVASFFGSIVAITCGSLAYVNAIDKRELDAYEKMQKAAEDKYKAEQKKIERKEQEEKDKIERKEQEEKDKIERKENEGKPKPAPKIWKIGPVYNLSTVCPLCGSMSNVAEDRGIKRIPSACNDRYCAAKNYAHLHAHCLSCDSKFFVDVVKSHL